MAQDILHESRFTEDLIQAKVRRIIRSSGFGASDADDLQQELRLRLIQASARFDPTRGNPEAFIVAVLARTVALLHRRRRRQSRRDSEIEAQRRSAAPPNSRFEQIDLATDVAAILTSLPPDLRDLALRLTRRSLAEVARDMGVPRSTLQRRVERIREHFRPVRGGA